MHWTELEELIHDHKRPFSPQEVEKYSQQILESLHHEAKPLQAAKMAYVLVLLQLKSKQVDEHKAFQFLKHLHQIVDHEIQETRLEDSDQSHAHLLYVRKLAEHYYHHLMVLSSLKDAGELKRKLKNLRLKNHEELLQLQQGWGGLHHHERKVAHKIVTKHYLFVGGMLGVALFFAWTSFWSLSDFVLNLWTFSTFNSEHLSELIRLSFLFAFSIAVMWFIAQLKLRLPEEDVQEE